MVTVIFILQVLSCIFLIGLILLQKGKGADIGAAFGGASNTVFGSRGPATFMNKLTIAAAAIFLSASLFLAHDAKTHSDKSIVDSKALTQQVQPKQEQTPPAEAAVPVEQNAPAPVEEKK